jgi:hypothetical protein
MQITADNDFGLNDCLAAEDDVGCADNLGSSGDFVARILRELTVLAVGI